MWWWTDQIERSDERTDGTSSNVVMMGGWTNQIERSDGRMDGTEQTESSDDDRTAWTECIDDERMAGTWSVLPSRELTLSLLVHYLVSAWSLLDCHLVVTCLYFVMNITSSVLVRHLVVICSRALLLVVTWLDYQLVVLPSAGLNLVFTWFSLSSCDQHLDITWLSLSIMLYTRSLVGQYGLVVFIDCYFILTWCYLIFIWIDIIIISKGSMLNMYYISLLHRCAANKNNNIRCMSTHKAEWRVSFYSIIGSLYHNIRCPPWWAVSLYSFAWVQYRAAGTHRTLLQSYKQLVHVCASSHRLGRAVKYNISHRHIL